METAVKIPCHVEDAVVAKDKLDRANQDEAARKLLREWLSDTSGYDEVAWPQAKKVIEENRLSRRSRFDD